LLVIGIIGRFASVFSSGVSGGPFLALATPVEFGTIDLLLIHWFTILVRDRLQGLIRWRNESGILTLVLLGGATLFAVVARAFLLLGLGAVAS
jgi:hypothetical protein